MRARKKSASVRVRERGISPCSDRRAMPWVADDTSRHLGVIGVVAIYKGLLVDVSGWASISGMRQLLGDRVLHFHKVGRRWCKGQVFLTDVLRDDYRASRSPRWRRRGWVKSACYCGRGLSSGIGRPVSVHARGRASRIHILVKWCS